MEPTGLSEALVFNTVSDGQESKASHTEWWGPADLLSGEREEAKGLEGDMHGFLATCKYKEISCQRTDTFFVASEDTKLD